MVLEQINTQHHRFSYVHKYIDYFNKKEKEIFFYSLSDIIITLNTSYCPINCYYLFWNLEKKVNIRLLRYLHLQPSCYYLTGQQMRNIRRIHYLQACMFLNEHFMEWRYQIKDNVPHSDIDNGFSYCHFWNEKHIQEDYNSLLDLTDAQ